MTPHLSHLKVPLIAKFTITVERSNEGEEREKEVELLWERASCSHKAHA